MCVAETLQYAGVEGLTLRSGSHSLKYVSSKTHAKRVRAIAVAALDGGEGLERFEQPMSLTLPPE